MSIEVVFGMVSVAAVSVLFWQAWWTLPVVANAASPQVPTASASPPVARHDVLNDYAAELNFHALTAEGAVEHRMALLEALLREAEHESVRMELLVDKLGLTLFSGSERRGSAAA